MPHSISIDYWVGIFRDTILSLVRRDGPDLSARQMAVLLTCYTPDAPHTVRGLALALNVSKPAITRALDRLSEFEFVRRKVDPADRRSVLVQRTPKGAAYVRDLRAMMADAEANAREANVDEIAMRGMAVRKLPAARKHA
jgi:DNA-binding MarR family transcriptional regulator